ncbi:hypothetical protein D3C72_1567290 [compost metagenome]
MSSLSSRDSIWAAEAPCSAARTSTSRVKTKGRARNLSRLLRSRAALIWPALRAWAIALLIALSRAHSVATCRTPTTMAIAIKMPNVRTRQERGARRGTGAEDAASERSAEEEG